MDIFQKISLVKQEPLADRQWISSARRLVEAHIALHPMAPRVSIWEALWRRAGRSMAASLGVAVLLFLGINAVSANSLPGDALYAWKVGVSEPFQAAMVVGIENKVQFHVGLLQQRLNELEKVNASPSSSPAAAAVAVAQLKTQINVVSQQVDQLEATNSDAALQNHAVVAATLDTHKQILTSLEDKPGEKTVILTSLAAIDDAIGQIQQKSDALASKSAETVAQQNPEDAKVTTEGKIASAAAQLQEAMSVVVQFQQDTVASAAQQTLVHAQESLAQAQQDLTDQKVVSAFSLAQQASLQASQAKTQAEVTQGVDPEVKAYIKEVTASPSPTPSDSPTPSASPVTTPSPKPTLTPSATPSPSSTLTPSVSPSLTASSSS